MESTRSNLNENFFIAIKSGQINLVMKYLRKEADLSVLNENKETPIVLAAKLGYWDIVKAIADEKKTDSKDSYNYGNVLLSAVKDKLYYVVESLLKAGASMTWSFVSNQNGCLHCAVKNNDIKMVHLLLSYQIDLSQISKAKNTSIVLAAKLGYWGIVKAIADAQNTNSEDTFNYRVALDLAIQDNRFDVVKSLLEAGASGKSNLHSALKNKNSNMIGLLLSYNADQTALNENKQTPEQSDPQCFYKGWAVCEYNRGIAMIALVLLQLNRQFSVRLPNDILQYILNEAAGGFILDSKLTIERTQQKLNKISTQCFIKEYKQFGHFRSQESRALVEILKKDQDNLSLSQQHIDNFLNKKYELCPKEDTGSRAINLLIKYHLTTNQKVQQVKRYHESLDCDQFESINWKNS